MLGEAFENSITEFHYDTDVNSTFSTGFARFEDIFNVDFWEQTDDWKVRLLLRKMGPSEHDKYSNYILQRHPRDCSFAKTVDILKQIFSEHTSLFNAKFNCLNITKCDTVDFTTIAGTVNKECERFKISFITDEQFKCLIFVCGLRSTRYRDVCTRTKSKIEQNPDMTLQQAAGECRRLAKIWSMIQIWYNSPYPQQHPQSTPLKDNSTQHHLAQHKRNLHPLAGIVLAGILQGNVQSKYTTAAIATSKDTKKDSSPHRCTKQQTSNHITNADWKEMHTRTLVATFLSNSKSNRKYVSVKLYSYPVRLQIDSTSDIILISQKLFKTIRQSPLTSTRHVVRSASGDCVHITGELPAMIKSEDKTASGKVYVADSRHNLWGQFYRVTGFPSYPTQFYLQCSIQILNSESHYESNRKKYQSIFLQFFK